MGERVREVDRRTTQDPQGLWYRQHQIHQARDRNNSEFERRLHQEPNEQQETHHDAGQDPQYPEKDAEIRGHCRYCYTAQPGYHGACMGWRAVLLTGH